MTCDLRQTRPAPAPPRALGRGLALVLLVFVTLAGAARADPIEGDWLTPAGATIRIQTCGSAPCGKLIDFTPLPGNTVETQRDERHRDTSKRNRKLKDLTVVWNMAPEQNRWRARVYDPRRGISANATLTPSGQNLLKVRGCVRVVFNVCEEETWRRAR